ncbi:MAG: hypothetical protein AAF927_01555 [Bacteroidota bacterium]
MSTKNPVSPAIPEEGKNTALTVNSLVKKYELTDENERLANTAMLALIAQANLSGQAVQKDYVERLSGFFQKYQDLVKDLQKMAETNN